MSRRARQLNIWMDEELYQAIRTEAFKVDRPMSAWVRDQLEDDLMGDSDEARIRRGARRLSESR